MACVSGGVTTPMPHTIWEVGLSDLTWQLPDPCLGEDWSSARTRVQCVAALLRKARSAREASSLSSDLRTKRLALGTFWPGGLIRYHMESLSAVG